MSFDDEDLVASVLAFAEKNPNFSAELAEDLDDKLEKYGSLLPAQRNALWNQIKGWRIPIKEGPKYMQDVD